MGKMIRQVWFKHTDGALKKIPGVTNVSDLAPKLVQEVDIKLEGNGPVERPVFRVDRDHVVKLTLLDENVDVRLTDREKQLPEKVQERILARRAEEADAIIQANDALRDRIRSYEVRGGLKVIEWDKEVDVDSLDAREAIIAELSPIAIADMEARGIPIPDKFKRTPVAAQTTVDSGITVKAAPKKPKE